MPLHKDAPSRPLEVFQMDLWAIVPYYASYLCEALQQRGVKVTVGSITYHLDAACFRRHGLSNDPGLIDLVGKWRIGSVLGRRALKLVESCINLLALAIRFSFHPPDVVHVQYLQMMEWRIPVEVWLCWYAKRLGSKLVCTVHNVLPHMPVPSADRGRKAYGRLYRLADVLICHTRESQQALVKEFAIDTSRTVVIPHGPMFHDMRRPSRSAARAQLGFAESACVVLTQGFIAPYKGINFLLEVWARLQARHPEARLVVAGSGRPQWMAELREKVAALGIGGSVHLELRFIPAEELPMLFEAADILVYPYSEITGSGALMTGLTFRKPIVATNIPAFREILTHGDNALLAPYGDIQTFAGSLELLMDDSALQDRLASKAASVTHSWPEIARVTVQCYESLTAPEGSSSLAGTQTA